VSSALHRRSASLVAAVLIAAIAAFGFAPPANAVNYQPISGAGSTWSSPAILDWAAQVKQYGMRVEYAANGSSDGRNQFASGNVDFAVSEIPYGLRDGGVLDSPPRRGFAYMPIVAGGTAFMYNLKIGGRRVTNLRLSGPVIAKIFTGQVARWNDPAIAADNPGLALPAIRVVPVVRSDGSGTTAQFTTWMSKQYQPIWDDYCRRAHRSTPCGTTSIYPTLDNGGMISAALSAGVAGYVSQEGNVGSITYVEYAYAIAANFPVLKVLNHSGYYVEPTAPSVAVGLLGARINQDKTSLNYLTQDLTGVYNNADRRAYPLSSYSYMIVPTTIDPNFPSFTTAKGHTLAAFGRFFLCDGQNGVEKVGYSPLPQNLVQAGFDQIRRIPGVDASNIDIRKCKNPTFSADGSNLVAKTAPQPLACDHIGKIQCATGTGGAKAATPVSTRTTTTGTTTTAGGTTPTTTTAGKTTVPGTTLAGGGPTDPQLTNSGATMADPNAVPMALATSSTGGIELTLMIVAGLTVLLVTVVPPLVGRALRRGTSA
jgi:phosphate ABC transporter phosphate-binding protein